LNVPAILTGARPVVSSSWNSSHSAENAQLNSTQGGPGMSSAWCAGSNDLNQWFQLCFDSQKSWTKISIQGRGDVDQWVTEFFVKYSDDATNWKIAEDGKIFKANIDRNTIVTHTFVSPFTSKLIRIVPIAWKGHISMRIECYYQNHSSAGSFANLPKNNQKQ
jgi:hypothetical protein